MQASIFKKKGSSRVITCPRCGAESLTVQSACGKCGFIYPKEEKDAAKGSFAGAGTANAPAQGSFPGGAGQGSFSGGGSAKASTPVPISGVAPVGATPVIDGENVQEIPQVFTAHRKMDASSEGLIKERGDWMRCPRCNADVKADSARCAHCGWKTGKK